MSKKLNRYLLQKISSTSKLIANNALAIFNKVSLIVIKSIACVIAMAFVLPFFYFLIF